MIKLNLYSLIPAALIGLAFIPYSGTAQFAPPAYPSGTPTSYIRNWEVVIPIATPDNVNSGLPTSQAKLATKFVDGLGRPLQDVTKGGSLATGSAAVDLVTSYYYDALGREPYKYLPFGANNTGGNASIGDGQFKLNPFQEQAAFYSSGNTASPIAGQGETYYYGETNFESSPMDRPTETFLPGNNWAGTAGNGSPASRHSKKTSYWVNTATDVVRRWIVTNSGTYGSFATYATGGTYPANTLEKTVTQDEQGNETIEFRDTKGNLILKKIQYTATADDGTGEDHNGWLCTYYIYDDLNQLRCVIQPAGVQLLGTYNWDLTALSGNILNEQCYRYEYDQLKRLIAKQTPGTAPSYYVYDTRNRQVMTQDGHLRASSQWLCHLYDGMNRQVMTALITYSGAFSDLQTSVTNLTTPPSSNSGLQLDLTLPNASTPSPTTGAFQALHSVNLVNGFSTPAGGTFSAGITTGQGGSDGETSVVSNVLVNLNPIPSFVSGFQVLTILHYDDYAGLPAGLSSSLINSNYGTYLTASSGSPDYAQPVVASAQTKGLVTWTQALVLGTTSQYISSAHIYNEKGSLVQVQTINMTGGLDVTTNQYNFGGKLLYTHINHQNHDGAGQSYQLVTRTTYDDLQRVIKIEKNFNNTGYKTISALTYDAVGRVKTKQLGTDPNNSPNPLETLTYDYNIQGWLLGANRNNLATAGAPTNGTHFAFELGYDKQGNNTGQNFSNPQFNGNLAGMTWKSIGDDVPRKYDYTYDPTNRLFRADFIQQNADNSLWNNAEANYNVLMGDGASISSAYDANGNILRMQQWGWKHTSSAEIDDLNYVYYNNGNKLRTVTDNSAGGTPASGTPSMYLGDFVDKNSGSDDYGYDANGNLVTDMNKRLTGATGANVASGGAITYNFLNLPAQITVKKDDGVTTKGTISFVYDANGNKLQKITTEGTITTTTWYVDGFVYQTMINTADHSKDYTDLLQYIPHEEGRIRYRPANGALTAAYVFDYFIKDHLNSTRMVLTDETYVDAYPPATLEGDINTNGQPNAAYYEKQYYTIDPSCIVGKGDATGITDYINKNGGSNPTDAPVNNNPNSVVTANSGQLYKLTASSAGGVTGLGITLKVMSGDRIDVWGKSYWFTSNTSQSNWPVPVNTILSGLLGTPGGVTAGHGVGLSDLTGNSTLTGLVNGFTIDPNRNLNGGSTTPKAYINWILFDDNFQYVTGNFSRVGGAGVVTDHYNDPKLQDIQVTKNGYIYVYVENESPVSVYFDNLQVVHTHGPLLEDTHYYPFGLVMEGISDKALRSTGYPENKQKFNGKELQNKEFSDGQGLEWTDYGGRMYDQQIGRWHKTDGKAELYLGTSPYVYALDQPIHAIDPDGNLVIFINGFFAGGEGGSAAYWRQKVSITTTYNTVTHRNTGPHHKIVEQNFDVAVMNRLGDHKPMYVDGSDGGLDGLPDNMYEKMRETNGTQDGKLYAAGIIASLSRDKNNNINESIKIISHSMGSAYAKGYAKAILDYAREHKIQGVVIEFEADFAPFQSAQQKAVKDKNMGPTYQFSHKEHVAGHKPEEGAIQMNTDSDPQQEHTIFSFMDDIANLPTGHYTVVNGEIIPDSN